MIINQIKDDLKNALKSGDSETVSTLRLVLSAAHNREIIKRGSALEGADVALTDEEAIEVLRQEAKKRKEAAELLRKGGREDMAKREEEEAKIIGKYLPQLMSKEEIAAVVDKLMAAGLKDFNSLMKESMKTMKGKAEGSSVSEIVKEKVSAGN
jgi:uncharacterized protein YqeY